jgi:hypothetical protein
MVSLSSLLGFWEVVMLESRIQPCIDLVLLGRKGCVVIFDTICCFDPLHRLTGCVQDKPSSGHPSLPRGPRWSIGSIVLLASGEDQLRCENGYAAAGEPLKQILSCNRFDKSWLRLSQISQL